MAPSQQPASASAGGRPEDRTATISTAAPPGRIYIHLQSLIEAGSAAYKAEIFALREDPRKAMAAFSDYCEHHPAMNRRRQPSNLQKHWWWGVCNAVMFSHRRFFFWRSCSEQLSKVRKLRVKRKQDSSTTNLRPEDYVREIATLLAFLSMMHATCLARELKLLLPGSPGMRGLFSYKKDDTSENPKLIPSEDLPLTNLSVLLCGQNGYHTTALDEIIRLLSSTEVSQNTSRLVLMILSDLQVVQILLDHLIQPSHEWTTGLQNEKGAILRTPNAMITELGITAMWLRKVEAALRLSSHPDFEQDMKAKEERHLELPLQVGLPNYLDGIWKSIDDVSYNIVGWSLKEKFNPMFKNSDGLKKAK
ncbi:uncharacterized protein PAC_16970 [Phialocephala subalpina]|uniref:Uncharacterized protein n=1 Tax=Phialocephala subalpina TaxID=576137 RepID=A0A1L7XPU4_9HELO|nr:uncharacterized protein PAC_16970 [Phialocephala subalpina]